MKKLNWLIFGIIIIFIAAGWFVYHKITDDTYQGMSIIPEKHEDIPLFQGLEPTEHVYVLDGNRWNDIYDFYLKKLPQLGWKLEYESSALTDHDSENDWSGFHSRWRKEGFDGELSISAHYNQYEQQTEVSFDQTPIYHSTTWIDQVPESICIYQSMDDETCSEIKDNMKIQQIADFINEAIDWKEEVSPRKNTIVIDFGDMKIKVLYENEKEAYFQSDKGTKLMKPDPDFFEHMNLSQ
ncbi:hypothetical protein [Bacillus dakarensis]|uniref:hypothetical protein n=1 Tax=Robertmurraya dakarensis TaxID=1926278 RepID=UPI000981C073|nr:hypothetical protein [Bacillus dakarensis]